jgi:hypothetical protein
MNTSHARLHTIGQIQRWMQSVIMHPRSIHEGIASADARRHIDVDLNEVEQVVNRSRALTAAERLAIYGYAYYARLLECMREEFPVLLHALGRDVFDAFAADYLQKYPSRSYTLMKLGSDFPRYLVETRPEAGDERELPADWPDFLIDLATLELAFNEVFDGPGTEGISLLDPDQLSMIAPGRLAEARLAGVSCLRLIALRYPVHRYITAVRRHEDPALLEPAETYLAVTRRDFVVRHYELSRPAYQLLSALLDGEAVGEAIAWAAETTAPDLERFAADLREWFNDWAAEGFFRSLAFPGNDREVR